MHREWTKAELEAAFVAALDEALPEADAGRFQAELDGNDVLKQNFAQYRRAVSLLRQAPRERAPASLASMILRRTRRRRFSLQVRRLTEAHRFPAEIVIPLLIAAVAALFLLLAQ